MWTDEPRRRKRHKAGPSAGLIVGLSIGGIVLLVVVALGLRAALKKPGGGGGLALTRDVAEDEYQAVNDGATYAEVQAIVGPGRVPTESDLDRLFGRRGESRSGGLHSRGTWEAGVESGRARAWGGAARLMLVVFTAPPEQGGRVLHAVFQNEDGLMSVSYGTGQPAVPPPPPTPEPVARASQPRPPVPAQPPAQPPTSATAAGMLAEFAADGAAASRKYLRRRVTVTGPMTRLLGAIVYYESNGSTVTARLDAVGLAQIGRKRPGDTVIVTGIVQTYSANNRTVMMDTCTLDN